GPIGPQRQADALVEQRAKRIRRLDALRADAPLGPPAVVDGVIRLHGGDDLQRGEPIEILWRDVLRVLDPQAPVALPVRANDLTEQIENLRDGCVADGMKT